MSYVIFKNKNTNKKLVYYPCAKNANSSAKLFFVNHLGIENQYIFPYDNKPSYEITINDFKNKKNLTNFLPNYQPFQIVAADYKCCIIRNPIERFISAYTSRILFHKDISFRNYSVDMVLEKLHIGNFENKHFLPQTYSLGNNLNYYTFYSDVNDIKFFEQKVNDFFGKKIKFPKIHKSQKKLNINLTNLQINKIKKIYSDDYNLISNL